MRVFSVPARYAPDVEASVRELVMRARMDAQLGGGVIPPENIEPDRIGTLMVIVADLASPDAMMSVRELAAAAPELSRSTEGSDLMFAAGLLP